MQSAVTELGDTGLQLATLCLQSLFVPTVPLAQETHKSWDPGLSGRYSYMAAYVTASQPSVPYKAHQVGQGNGRKNISKLHKIEAKTATYPSRQGPAFKTAGGGYYEKDSGEPNPLVWFTEIAGSTPFQPALRCQRQLATH